MSSCFLPGYASWSMDPIQLWRWMTRIMYLMMDDLVSFGFFDLSYVRCHTGAYPVLDEIYRSSWSCMLISTYEVHTETMTLQWSLTGTIQLGLHLSALRCHHASFRDTSLDLWVRLWTWMTEIMYLTMDDLMSPDFSTYHTFDAILGHIPFRMRFIGLHGVACSYPLTRYTPRRWPSSGPSLELSS